jgi:hypothetical protein
VERGASIITYHVYVGLFNVTVKMLNIDEFMSHEKNNILKRGSFGSIQIVNDGKSEFVAKRIHFTNTLKLMSKQKHGL